MWAPVLPAPDFPSHSARLRLTALDWMTSDKERARPHSTDESFACANSFLRILPVAHCPRLSGWTKVASEIGCCVSKQLDEKAIRKNSINSDLNSIRHDRSFAGLSDCYSTLWRKPDSVSVHSLRRWGFSTMSWVHRPRGCADFTGE